MRRTAAARRPPRGHGALDAVVRLSEAAPPPAEAPEIDAYVRALPYLPVEQPRLVAGVTSAAQRDGDHSCTTESLKETRQLAPI